MMYDAYDDDALNENRQPVDSRQLAQESSERNQTLEIAASVGIIAYQTINLVVYYNEPKCGHFQLWLLGSMLIYIFDLVVCMNQLMQVKKRGRENLWLILLTVVVLAINTAWYIWGNILYYRNWEECAVISELHPTGVNPGTTSALRFMIFIGYVTFCKCCMVTMCAVIGIPCLCYHYRQMNQPGWTGAAPDLIKRLAKTKFEGGDPEAGGVECCVCLSEFERNEEVVELPCSDKHVFHMGCVKGWLEQNNSCPLCKAPITREALDRQRRTQSARASTTS